MRFSSLLTVASVVALAWGCSTTSNYPGGTGGGAGTTGSGGSGTGGSAGSGTGGSSGSGTGGSAGAGTGTGGSAGSGTGGSAGSGTGGSAGSGTGGSAGSGAGGSAGSGAGGSAGSGTGGSAGSGAGGATGTCTNPVWSTSDPQGTDNIDPGNQEYWWIDNDAWSGSHGPQSLYVCSQQSWYAVSNQTDNQGQVETYPNTEYDVGGRANGTPTKTIAQYTSITSTFSEAFPSAGSWDAAYDLWLNNWNIEIMIWNEWTGTQLYWPPSGAQQLTLNGVAYQFYNNGGELMFFRKTMVKSGSVDILAAFKWLVTQGLVKSTDVPTQLEYGVEICSTNGSETFPLTGLTFSVN